MPRTILHLDLDAFFCSVEERRNPALVGRPFAVGGRPERRGVVSSCSYAARQYGVRSAMPMARALRLCRELIVVPPDFRAYEQASEQVMAQLHQLTPLVEQLSIDEAFLDVSDLPEPGEVIARRLQASINQAPGLPCSLGVASNKLVAKIANNVGKALARSERPPNAIQVVPPGQEAAFLAPLPVQELWGVGPKTAQRLADLGIHTIGQLAAWPEAELVLQLGRHARDLIQRARGIDDSPIEPEREAKSLSQETTFAHDIADEQLLHRTLRQLAEQVGRRLRRQHLSGSTVKIKLRWADFTTLTRQVTLEQPTNLDNEIYAAAVQLFSQAWLPGKRVRLVGVGVSGFAPPVYQLGLWTAPSLEHERRLQAALDKIRDRFGEQAIRRARQLQEGE